MNLKSLFSPVTTTGPDGFCPDSHPKRISQVHEGFYNGFMSIKQDIDTHLIEQVRSGRCKEVYFAGHSAGGAIVTCALAYFLEVLTPLVIVQMGCKVNFTTIGGLPWP